MTLWVELVWLVLVKMVINFRFRWGRGNSLSSWVTVSFSRERYSMLLVDNTMYSAWKNLRQARILPSVVACWVSTRSINGMLSRSGIRKSSHACFKGQTGLTCGWFRERMNSEKSSVSSWMTGTTQMTFLNSLLNWLKRIPQNNRVKFFLTTEHIRE
jgi:hypothetical protein